MDKPKKTKILFCKRCNYTASSKSNWNRHLLTKKHIEDRRRKKKKKVRECKVCSFITTNRGSWYSHMRGKRHLEKVEISTKIKKLQDDLYAAKLENALDKQKAEIMKQESERSKQEHKRSSRHMEEAMSNTTEVLKTLTKNGIGSVTNNTVNNTVNNPITINVFLNENCKNAMNLEDFVSKLTVGVEDINYAISNGGPKAIGRLLIKNLQKLNPTERPIHCSDEKRQRFYIKCENQEEKGDGKEGTRWDRAEKHIQKVNGSDKQKLDWQIQRTHNKFTSFLAEWLRDPNNKKKSEQNGTQQEQFWLKACDVLYGLEPGRYRRKVKRQIAPEILIRAARDEADKILEDPAKEHLAWCVRDKLNGFEPTVHLDKNKVIEMTQNKKLPSTAPKTS
jgi:hypothetical protein